MKKLHGKPIRFTRWGGLSSVKQKGYNPAMPTFHSPPCRRGIYAFVWPYIETFLLGGYGDNQQKWNKGEIRVVEETGQIIEEPYGSLKPPRNFDYEGDIWHHSGRFLHPNKIIQKRGSWYKTTFENFIEALRKNLHDMKCHSFNSEKAAESKRGYYPAPTNNPTHGWVKDDIEVFIEKV